MSELQDRYIRFDWAIKRLLRQKANFDVLEGFLTVFLGEPIRIIEILESEGNQETVDDKFNRVDIKARNSKDEIIIIEVQNTRELYYLERILYGVAKAITEHISLGDSYLHQHPLFRHRERKRLPLSRTEPLHRRAHPRRASGERERAQCLRNPYPCLYFPRIHPDSGQ